jgi:hypothetical protein
MSASGSHTPYGETDALIDWLEHWGEATRGERSAFIDGFRAAKTPASERTAPKEITFNLSQACQLLQMFGGEDAEITVAMAEGHSGKGLYAHYTELPEEGAELLDGERPIVPPAIPAFPEPVAAPGMDDKRLPDVGGRRLECTIAVFERRCQVLLGEEQRKPSPDNALIAVLCDAVRCAREYVDVVGKYVEAPTTATSATPAASRAIPTKLKHDGIGAQTRIAYVNGWNDCVDAAMARTDSGSTKGDTMPLSKEGE